MEVELTPTQWFLLIFMADIAAAIVFMAAGKLVELTIIRRWRKTIENVMCDICHKPRKTFRTFDKKLWACRQCRKVYRAENKLPKIAQPNENA